MAFALTTSDFALQEDTLLVAWVRKGEDTWVQSQIDLNKYIGSYNGEFDVASSAKIRLRSLRLALTSTTLSSKDYVLATTENFTTPKSTWTITSGMLKAKLSREVVIFSKPVTGFNYIPRLQSESVRRCSEGGIYSWGCRDQVAEAIAECTSSSITAISILVGAAIGTIIGNATIGLAIGTGMTAPGGISPEIESLVTCINDPLILARSLEAAIGRYIYGALRNLLSPNAMEYFVIFMNVRLEPKIDEIGNAVLDCLGAANMSRGASISLETAIIRATDALCKQKIPEWSDLDLALQMIHSQQLDHFHDDSSS
ncbi:uncharacterized protein DFL_009281 [Arthrobotrys flagrans]|uniref:Cyanovirin-N domain-containing protein n=1 Tax=Arthrobotrys flagrans TaxID=97331 RepID=A0A436ZRN3_ARTFL|nr:hypothetical protein DFL_009281 [Arthrobotrys flagrans]